MIDPDNSNRPFEVGYSRPPKHTQFRKGTSGNPKGRGKGVRNFVTEIQEELDSSVPVVENGKHKRITKRKAIAKQLVNKPVGGDPKAIPVLLNETRPHEAETEDKNAQSADLQREDQLVLENIIRRIRASLADPSAAEPAPAGQSPLADISDPSPTEPEEKT
jgi:hypothetical protein